MKTFLILSILSSLFFSSDSIIEDDLNIAFINAKKGMYWGLSNLRSKKIKMENKLVDGNKLLAEIKVSKEINGVKIESTGFNNSTEICLKIYRSYDNLIKDGYLEKSLDDY
jgi:hypothetical protein